MLSTHLTTEIQRLTLEGQSIRQISRVLGVCRQSVRRYKDGNSEPKSPLTMRDGALFKPFHSYDLQCLSNLQYLLLL